MQQVNDSISTLHRDNIHISRRKKLLFISENIQFLNKTDRRNFLQIVLNSMDRGHVQVKGSGTQFITKYASDELVDQLYYLVENKIDSIIRSSDCKTSTRG